MKDSKLRFTEELLKEIADLKVRASNIDYKNPIPKLPENTLNFEQSMAGFNYRLYNWKKQLLQLENPGGLPSGKHKVEKKEENLGHFVIRSNVFDNFNDDNSEV